MKLRSLRNSRFICLNPSVFSLNTQDIQPLEEDACEFYGSASGYAYDTYYTQVMQNY